MIDQRGHIVFDCDGTLISSLIGIQQGLQTLFSEHLGRTVSLQEVRDKYTADMIQILDNFQIDHTDPKLVDALQRRWMEISTALGTSSFALFPGIVELIDQLESLNYKMYVWTARDRMSTLSILKSLGVISRFEEIRCYDDTTPKPHPMGLEEMVGEFAKDKVVVIGDSTADIQGAKSFSCLSIAALWSDGVNEEKMQAMKPDLMAYNPSDCLSYIKKNI